MSDIDNFASLFRTQVPLIDTRAPVEFERGSMPTATNLPLMNDTEREAVGRCYKNEGAEAAIALGHQLVTGSLKEDRIAAWIKFANEHPDGALFCFRGGMRSGLAQQWLKDAGIDYPRISGGYKALRRWLIDSSDNIYAQGTFLVVAGKTGCAKTRLINHGASGGRLPGGIDLEGMANHRGSSFGRRDGGQPTQINFEIAVDSAIFNANDEPVPFIIAEDESRLIGRCALAQNLQDSLKSAPMVVVEASLDARVEHSFENYILANLADLKRRLGDTKEAFEHFSSDLYAALDRIKKRLGGVRHHELTRQLDDAIASHLKGDTSVHRGWIATLLRDYYDPMYNYQLENRKERIIFRGSEGDVAEFLLAQQHEPTPE
ncbi:tRNA 2-selenouridine(34) synthase MnmH [Luminiphilus sp. nBUS_16]|uniref:tRNA 2-selenouridine(34) synthase MnmH n=1 Tax=Luminiphilus sp. nBUS_16 TaxID=3395315 RepID=UPI003EBDF4B0